MKRPSLSCRLPAVRPAALALRRVVAPGLLAGAVFAGPLRAQEPEPAAARVQGRVTDTAGVGVAGARVHFVRSGFDVRTGPDGRFAVVALLRLPDTVRVAAIGYGPFARSLAAVPPGGLAFTLAPAPVAMQEVVVTGARRALSAAELTTQVTTLSSAEMAARAVQSVDRAVDEIPGLQGIAFPPTGSNVVIRGIGESRVLVLLDGEPTPGAQLENRDLSRYSTTGIQQVEVVKGPLSALYGSDALGGVINIITQPPAGPVTLDGLARVGSLGRREGNATVSGGTGRLGARLTGAWRQQDRVPGVTTTEDVLQRVWDVRGSVRYALGTATTLRADVNYLRERQRWPVAPGFSGFSDNTGITAWTEAAVDKGRGGTWRTRVFFQDYDHRYRQSVGDEPIANTGPPTQREQIVRGVLGHSRAIGGHRLDAGMDLSWRHVEAADKLVGNQLSDRMVEGYVQDGARYGRLLTTLALRGTWNSRWGGAVTPSVGLAYEPSGSVRLHGSLGRGFRGPSFKELGWTFANLQGGYTIQGNPDLVPESSWQVAFGATWSPAARLVLDAEVYRNDVRNMILQQVNGFTEAGLVIFTPRNVQDAVAEGAEANLRYDSEHWLVSAGYAYLYARDQQHDTPLNRRAPHMVRSRLGYRAATLRGLQLDVTGRYTSSAPLVGEALAGAPEVVGEQGALLAFDVQGRVALTRAIELSLGADNVFDARPAGWQGAVQRTVYLGMRVRATPGQSSRVLTGEREEDRREAGPPSAGGGASQRD